MAFESYQSQSFKQALSSFSKRLFKKLQLDVGTVQQRWARVKVPTLFATRQLQETSMLFRKKLSQAAQILVEVSVEVPVEVNR